MFAVDILEIRIAWMRRSYFQNRAESGMVVLFHTAKIRI